MTEDEAMFLAKSGPNFVKAIGGKPCFRSTQNLSEAARFENAAAAGEWAANVFSGSMLAAVKIVSETSPSAARNIPSRMTRYEMFNDEPNHPGDGYMGR